jgi:hypothetical protein
MRGSRRLLVASTYLVLASIPTAIAAQEPAQTQARCRDLPCAVVVDWTKEGGVGNQSPDRRYGNPAQLEERVKARLTERGFQRYGSTDDADLRIVLVPQVRPAMCDELQGTAAGVDTRGFRNTDCKAIAEVEARLQGPDGVTRGIEIPNRIRNRCTSDQMMAVDKLGEFVADWIVYAVEGKSKGEKRPVARCR